MDTGFIFLKKVVQIYRIYLTGTGFNQMYLVCIVVDIDEKKLHSVNPFISKVSYTYVIIYINLQKYRSNVIAFYIFYKLFKYYTVTGMHISV